MTRSKFMTGAAVAALLLGLPLTASAQAQHPLHPPGQMKSHGDMKPSGDVRSQDMRANSPARDQMQQGQQVSTSSTTTTRESVSVDVLRERLQPQGEFAHVDKLGEVWRPRDVAQDWQPYTNGRWIFNQQVGWYFESDEPWAEVTYHYGRWYDDPDQGWVWVAGTEWAPAWVEWRRNKQYVGWRPLPPENAPRRTSPHRGSRGAGSMDVTEIQEEWVFIPTREITSERITTVRVRPTEVVGIYRDARPIGSVERRGSYAVNFALQPTVLEREANIRITSQNLPRTDAVPVPQQVRAISTGERTTSTSTSTTQSRPAQNAPASADTTKPGEPARPGSAGTAQDDKSPNAANRPATADTAKPGEAKPGQNGAQRTGEQVNPRIPRPGQNQAERNNGPDRRDTTGAVKRPGQPDSAASKAGETGKQSATDATKRPDANQASTNARGQSRAEQRRLPQGEANTNASGQDHGPARAEQRRPDQGNAAANAGGQERGQSRAEQRRPPQGEANTNATGQDRGPARAEQRRPEQTGQARPPVPETTGTTRPSPGRSGNEGPAMERGNAGAGGHGAGPAAGAERGGNQKGEPAPKKLPTDQQ